jgi:prophage antirepressor-like protein
MHAFGSTILFTYHVIRKRYLSEANLHRQTLKSERAGADELLDWICDSALPALRFSQAAVPQTAVPQIQDVSPLAATPPSKSPAPQASPTLSANMASEIRMKATEAEIEKEVWALREKRYKALIVYKD